MKILNSIELKSYGISFGDKVVLNNVSLALNKSGVTTLIGPKGSGKTSLLSSLAGIHDNTASFKSWGAVYFLGKLMGAEALSVRPVFVRPLMSQLNQSLRNVILSHYKFNSTDATARQEFLEKLILDAELEELLPMLQQRLIDLEPAWYRIVMLFVAAASNPSALMLDNPMKKLKANEVSLLVRYIRHLGKQQKIIVALDNNTHAHEMADDVVLLTANGVQFHSANDIFFANPPPNDMVSHFLQTGKISSLTSKSSNATLADSTISVDASQTDVVTDDEIPSGQGSSSSEASAEQIFSLDYESLLHDTDNIGNVNSGNLDADNFAWIIRGILAVCSMPGTYNSLGYDLDILASEGVTKLITLTPEDIYQAELAAQGLSNIHMPVYEGKTPSLTQMHMLLLRMKGLIENDEVLAVYCLDGCGAAGVAIAAWLIKEDGFTVEGAVKKLRSINPTLIQSLDQLDFLTDFSNDLRN